MLRLRIFPRAVPGVAPTEQSAENGQTRRMTCHIQIALMRYIMIHEIPYKYRPNFCAALRPGYTSRRNQSRSASCFILLHVSGNHLSSSDHGICFLNTFRVIPVWVCLCMWLKGVEITTKEWSLYTPPIIILFINPVNFFVLKLVPQSWALVPFKFITLFQLSILWCM